MTDKELIEVTATEVMGWNRGFLYDGRRISYDHLEKRWFDLLEEIPFNPLTNANHWMMVVEKLCSLFFEVRLYCSRKLFMCDIHREGYPVPADSWCAESQILGHAVCLAALEAVRSLKQLPDPL
jgi:hypothetical protein